MVIPSSLLLIAFALVASTLVANSELLVNLSKLARLEAIGHLTCSIPSPLPQAQPLTKVKVTLTCNGGRSALGEALTNTNGFFQVIISVIDSVLLDTSNCAAYAKLRPGLNCTLFPPTGTLRSAVNVLGIVDSVSGPVLVLGSPPFRLIN
ncbi:Pollen Ole e 1 allergen and extensin family protein [Parasponia andersonii]|uniref:Pollen Ole e 1 allergen and extensin family protein n=1 Tax=Parasponia andersonii TaxID=3476 RepID=A0A2P5A4S1_PARAD|nr:Pollen Ole e 1 allergen and extensin family protein [Parasponia andersonii]